MPSYTISFCFIYLESLLLDIHIFKTIMSSPWTEPFIIIECPFLSLAMLFKINFLFHMNLLQLFFQLYFNFIKIHPPQKKTQNLWSQNLNKKRKKFPYLLFLEGDTEELLYFIFIFFTLQYCIGFAIHQLFPNYRWEPILIGKKVEQGRQGQRIGLESSSRKL